MYPEGITLLLSQPFSAQSAALCTHYLLFKDAYLVMFLRFPIVRDGSSCLEEKQPLTKLNSGRFSIDVCVLCC